MKLREKIARGQGTGWGLFIVPIATPELIQNYTPYVLAGALLFAGGDHGGSNGKGLTYANPIAAVFKALKVKLA